MGRLGLVSFPEIEAWKCDDLIEKVRRGDCLSPCEDDMPQPASGDSYNQFFKRNQFMCLSYAELQQRDRHLVDARGARQAEQQEAMARASREVREAAQRRWQLEEKARREAAKANEEARQRAYEKAADEAATRKAAERRMVDDGPPLTKGGSRSYWALVSKKFDDEALVSITIHTSVLLQVSELFVPFTRGHAYLVPALGRRRAAQPMGDRSMTARPRPFRLRMPEPLEADTHAACAQALDRLLMPPAVWFTYPAGAVQLSPQQMARYSRLGLKRGLPDIWVLHQGTYCIELKRRGAGRLSKTTIGRMPSGAPRDPDWPGRDVSPPARGRRQGHRHLPQRRRGAQRTCAVAGAGPREDRRHERRCPATTRGKPGSRSSPIATTKTAPAPPSAEISGARCTAAIPTRRMRKSANGTGIATSTS